MRWFFVAFFCLFTSFLRAERPVDIVYTWVDGSDETWLAQKKISLSIENRLLLTVDGYSLERYQNGDALKYSLRSILLFAPWVHHIYIVTAGQTPSWLNDNPLITIVDHKQIFKNQNCLPTFNSHAIEANLHHISGLAEKYIYFNDNVLLGHSVTTSDFFTEDGKAKVFVSDYMDAGRIQRKDPSRVAANKNTTGLLSQLFGEREWEALAHTMQPCKRSAAYAAEKKIPEIFAKVSSHRFRSLEDYAMTNGIIPHHSIQTGYAVPASIAFSYILCGEPPAADMKELKGILEQKPLSICIQEGGSPSICKEELTWFFEQYFPDPAPWEKATTG